MIRSAILLVRTSLPSVLLLASSLVMLSSILSDDPGDGPADQVGSLPSLAPLPPTAKARSAGSAILQSALFDPGRRAETISGSIDDLRSGAEPRSTAVALTVAGVLLSGGTRKAMVSVGGAAPAWSSVGADVEGWRVASVDEDGAVLERDGQSLTLKVADRFKLRGKARTDPGTPSPDAIDAAPQPPPEPADTSGPMPTQP